MESFGDLMSVPPMHRDIGATFLAYQMPMPMMGMPYAGGYGISPLKPTLSQDKFEMVSRHQDKQKKDIKKILSIVGGTIVALTAFALLKKKLPAVGSALKKTGQSVKDFFTKLFTKTPKS